MLVTFGRRADSRAREQGVTMAGKPKAESLIGLVSAESPAPLDTTTVETTTVDAMAVPGDKLLRRVDVARHLNCSTSTIRRMEGTVLTPVVGPGGVHLFHERHVREVVQRGRSSSSPDAFDGEMAARAFELFDAGMNVVDVVKETKFDPRAVKAMQDHWARARGCLVIPADSLRELCRIDWIEWVDEAFPLVEARYLIASLKASKPEPCERCERKTPTLCVPCMRALKRDEALRLARKNEADQARRQTVRAEEHRERDVLAAARGAVERARGVASDDPDDSDE
jgi:hypothetical protein